MYFSRTALLKHFKNSVVFRFNGSFVDDPIFRKIVAYHILLAHTTHRMRLGSSS